MAALGLLFPIVSSSPLVVQSRTSVKINFPISYQYFLSILSVISYQFSYQLSLSVISYQFLSVVMKFTSAVGLSPLGAYHSLMYGHSMYFDIERVQRELEWTPRYSNVDMFCQSYDWYLANRETVLSRPGGSHHRSAVKQGILALVSRVLNLF